MLFRLIAAIALTASPALAQSAMGMPESRARDSYTFERAEYERPSFPVNLVLHQNRGEMLALFRTKWPDRKVDGKMRAFSILRRDGMCEIHAMDPRVQHQPEYIGHELLHCSMGRWHNN